MAPRSFAESEVELAPAEQWCKHTWAARREDPLR